MFFLRYIVKHFMCVKQTIISVIYSPILTEENRKYFFLSETDFRILTLFLLSVNFLNSSLEKKMFVVL